mmetsp:Transcript_15529/g.24169  ORF Transcript_15529/g.24169 Transcript_15529/m.24169 type:complete len:90 (+) Transcript_15529:163-432(+)
MKFRSCGQQQIILLLLLLITFVQQSVLKLWFVYIESVLERGDFSSQDQESPSSMKVIVLFSLVVGQRSTPREPRFFPLLLLIPHFSTDH